jgi:outer membrane protein assembly factor BamB
MKDGALIWTSHLPLEFGAAVPKWGYAASPLLMGKRLILQPGATEAAIIALDPDTADLIWQTPGRRAAYASLIHATVNGKPQLIGYDERTLGAWDPATGKRLWEHSPLHAGDFNVPTPLFDGRHLILCTETNGTRLHGFDPDGRLIAQPLATCTDLAPDSHTPVLAGGRLIGFHTDLHILDAGTLRPLATVEDRDFGIYASLITDGSSVLTLGERGVLFLHDIHGAAPRELGRLKLCESDTHLLSHPALVGDRLFVRMGERIACLCL